MKKVLFLCICCLLSFVCNAKDWDYTNGWGAQYKVTDAVKDFWGNPRLNLQNPQDNSVDYIASTDDDKSVDTLDGRGFRIKEGWACCGGTVEAAEIDKDDQAIMAFVAHNITEHGAEFCLTEITVASGPQFSLWYQEPNWPGLGCHWFCEPGWDGEACQSQTNSDSACNITNFKERIREVAANKYTGNDALAVHGARQGVAEFMAVFDSGYVWGVYPHEIVLGAVGFMEHGIVAKPISLGAVGDAPKITWLTSSGATGKQKVLCAQGFTADDRCNVSSKNCGKTMWCDAKRGNEYYKEGTHKKQINGFCETFVCADTSKALNDKYECVDCPSNGLRGRCDVISKPAFGKCVDCGIGQFFNPATCECDTARRLSVSDMQYGARQSDVVANQCWTKNDTASYKECVLEALK